MTTLTLTGRARWTFADGLTVVGRDLNHIRRAPAQLLSFLIFPAIMVVLFGYVFGSAISVPGGGNYREYLMPGLFAMTAFTSVMATTLAIADDAAKGVMDRFRSMPMARSAVPFGQTGADIVVGLFGTVVMAGCGLAVGWRPHEGLARAAAAFGLLVLLRYAISWVGICLGLAVRDEKTADAITPLVLPVTMLANTFVPTGGMPTGLRAIAEWNPVSALAAACRQLFGNPGAPTTHTAWVLEHPVVATLAWSALLLAVFVPLGVRRYTTVAR